MFKVLIAAIAFLGLMMPAGAAPTRVGGNAQEKKLVKRVVPKYPPEAKAKGVQGLVRLQAVINKDGTVKTLKLLSGPEPLVPPSMEAVKQWVYEPTLVNGRPVEVITDIDVNYKLAQ